VTRSPSLHPSRRRPALKHGRARVGKGPFVVTCRGAKRSVIAAVAMAGAGSSLSSSTVRLRAKTPLRMGKTLPDYPGRLVDGRLVFAPERWVRASAGGARVRERCTVLDWACVQPAIARDARSSRTTEPPACGASERGTRPRTVGEMQEELRALLRAAQVRPPHLLVGPTAATGATLRGAIRLKQRGWSWSNAP
jgi:hypothetical protein